MSEKKPSDESTVGDKPKGVNRRKVLRAIGMTGGITMSLPFVQKVSADSVDTEAAERSDKVSQLLDLVDNPTIIDKEVKVLRGVEELDMTKVEMRTKIGVISYITATNPEQNSKGTDANSASFQIENVDSEIKKELPLEFQSVPPGVDVTLSYLNREPNTEGLGAENRIQLSRTLTEGEYTHLNEVTGSDISSAAYIGSTDGYYYAEVGESKYSTITIQDDGYKVRSVSPSSQISLQAAADEPIPNPCLGCASTQGACAQCSLSCLPEVGNLLDCGWCIYDNCRQLDYGDCGRCLAEIIPRIIV